MKEIEEIKGLIEEIMKLRTEREEMIEKYEEKRELREMEERNFEERGEAWALEAMGGHEGQRVKGKEILEWFNALSEVVKEITGDPEEMKSIGLDCVKVGDIEGYKALPNSDRSDIYVKREPMDELPIYVRWNDGTGYVMEVVKKAGWYKPRIEKEIHSEKELIELCPPGCLKNLHDFIKQNDPYKIIKRAVINALIDAHKRVLEFERDPDGAYEMELFNRKWK